MAAASRRVRLRKGGGWLGFWFEVELRCFYSLDVTEDLEARFEIWETRSLLGSYSGGAGRRR
jgi:hypothetical protein